MCRVEERVYVSAAGHRSMFEESFPCDKSRNGKLCSKVKRKTSEYHTKSGSFSRDKTPSPINPPTPTGTGTYLLQQRRPSSNGGRPSTRDGQKTIGPEIIINFSSKKEDGKRHSGVTVSTKHHKRSSLISDPIGSYDLIDDYLGSDASHTIRTGFPDTPLPAPAAFGASDNFSPTLPHRYHHRQTSSASSFTVPSQPPSLDVTSDPDYESPDTHRDKRYSSTVIHHQNFTASSSSPSCDSASKAPPKPYQTSVAAPRVGTQQAYKSDVLYPLDHGDLADRSASSHASSGAPENARKSKERGERFKTQEYDGRRKDGISLDRQVAEQLARENAKQVRFELDRPAARQRERAERAQAEKEKDRARAREEARNQERKDREKQERAEEEAKQRKKEVAKPSPIKQDPKSASRTRKPSMSQEQLAEQRRLLAAEEHRMQDERQVAEARDRDEQNALLRHKQDTREYFDPRAGDRSLGRHAIPRQPLISPPITSLGLARSNSHRRPSIHHSTPMASSQIPQDYSTRPSSARQKPNGPPVSFPANFNQTYERVPSTRRPSFTQDTPPSARIRRDSASSIVNPFIQDHPILLPSNPSTDPWALRNLQNSLPVSTVSHENRHNTLQQRGHAVINGSVSQAHHGNWTSYHDAHVFDDDNEDDILG